MQARIVALRHGANLQRSALHFVPLFRPSIIPSVRYVHIPRSNIGRLKEEIFDTDSPVKPSAPEIPLPSKPAEKSLLKQVSHLLKYLDSSVPISMRINRLRAFTLSLDPSQIHPSKPLVPLLLLRTLTFECTTLDDLSSMTRSVRVLQLQKAAINELCMAIINQCRDLARDNIGLASDSVKDMNMILSTMSIMGVETDEFPAELKSYMASAFKDIFKFPEQMGSFTDLSVALQAALRLSMDFTVVDEFEQSVMNCIAYQLQTGKSATSKDLIAIITSITKSPRFMDPNSIIATDSSARATLVALINAAFNAMAINATQSPMLGADFNLALNAVRSTIFRDNINDALRVSIGKAISNALPLVEDRNLPNIVRHLVDLKMRRGHISPEASGALVSEIEKRMTRIPLQSFAQILRGIYSLELESAIRQRRTFVAAVDSALPEMLSVFTGSSPSANTPSSSQQMSIQAWPQQSQESFVSMIHSFGKLPIKWADLSAPAKNSLLQSWSRLLPVVDQSGALTMIAAMSKMRVHYPNLLPHGLDATLVQLFQKMLDQRCSTYQLSAIWLSLGGMNAAWSHISEEMKTILTTCAHKMPMEEASVGVARIAPDSLYGMGLMGMKWREMPVNTQRYLTRLLSQYWTLITATTTNEATSRSMEQLLPTLIAGMGMMEMPVAYLDTIPRIPSTAAVTINWEKILQNSHLWHGARVALLWNSVSHVDDATWSTIPVNLMECLVRPLETSIQSLDNRALTILMAATVRLAIDLPWEVSTRKARKVHRNVELNRVCNALLLELVRRDAAMKAQHINGTSNKAAASTSTWNQVMLMQIRSFLLMMKQRVHEMSTSDPKSTASSPLIATWNTHRESWAPSFFSPETAIGSAKATKHIQSVDDLQTMTQGDSDRVQFHTVSKYHQTMSEMLRAALSKVDTSADSSHHRRRSRSQHQQHRDSDRFAVINEYFGLRWSVEDENTAVPDFAVDVAVFSSEQRQRPLAFVEINGPHHYIPVHTVQSVSSSTKKQEGTPPPAMKLRREDVVKEHFYRSVYPDIPLLRISANDARPRHQIIDEMVETILQREATMLEQLPNNEHPNATIKPAVAVPSPYKGDGKDVRKPKVVTAVEEIDDDKESKDSEESNVSKSPEVKDEVASEIDDFMTLVKPRVVDGQEKKKEKEFVTFMDNDEEDDEEDDDEDEDEDGEDEEFDEDEDEADDEAGIEELENDFIDEDEEEAELDDEAMFARMVLEAEEEDRRHRQLGSSSVDDDEDSTTERRSVSKGRQQKQFSDTRFSRREIPEKAAKQSGRGRYKKNDESAGEDRKFGKVGKIEVDDADADDSDDSDLPPPKYRLNI